MRCAEPHAKALPPKASTNGGKWVRYSCGSRQTQRVTGSRANARTMVLTTCRCSVMAAGVTARVSMTSSVAN
jgi:hypothetical protein